MTPSVAVDEDMSTREAVDVSVLIPVLDEVAIIGETIEPMRNQEFPGSFELIFLDGGSVDGTRPYLERLSREDSRIRVLDNPERRVPQALNIGLQAARGSYIARMDAHTYYPLEYLAVGVQRLNDGGVEWVSGPQIAVGAGGWSKSIALALSSRLGTGAAKFRYAVEQEIDVDSGFTGMWTRESLDSLQGWDEGWPVNQDGELGARIRERGGRIVCVPGMAARYAPRGSLKGLGRQYWRYGQYRAKTARRHPFSMRRSQWMPPALVVTVASAVLLRGPLAWLARVGCALYGTVVAAETARAARSAPASDAVRMPAVLATMHSTWGLGFLLGCLKFGTPWRALARVFYRSTDDL